MASRSRYNAGMRAPPRSHLPATVITWSLVLFLPWIALQIAGRAGHEPSRATIAGVNPLTAAPTARERVDHLYPDSPWRMALLAEAEHLPVDTERLECFADDVAREVGWWMLAETRTADVADAERVLWRRGHADRLAMRIAEGLHRRGVRHGAHLPLSKAFAAPAGDKIVLDADALTFLFLHVAGRLDLDMRAVLSPRHLYVQYQEPAGAGRIYVETSRLSGATVPPDLVPEPGMHRRAGGAAEPALADAARLHEPRDARDLEDAVVARLVISLVEGGVDVDGDALLASRLDGTRDARIVSMLHRWRVEEARAALSGGRPDAAALSAARAVALRRTHAALHDRPRLVENVLMGDVMQLLREDAAARAAVDRAIARGEGREVCDVLEPLGDELFELFPSCR